MTKTEMSNQFDVLYNNLTSNLAPGLNSYEKSVILTKGQEEVIKNYFNPKSNPKGEGFDDSPKRQADFSSLIRTATMIPASNPEGLDRRSHGKYIYTYPSDVFIALNELIFDTLTQYVVVPITYQEYDLKMSKPYKFPPKYLAWRLISGQTTKSETVTYTKLVPQTTLVPGELLVKIGDPPSLGEDTRVSFKFKNTCLECECPISWMGITEDSTDLVGEDIDGLHVYVPDTTKLKDLKTVVNNALAAAKINWNGIYITDYITIDDFVGITDDNKEDTLGINGDEIVIITEGNIIVPKAKYETTEVEETVEITVDKDVPIVELIGKFGSNFTYSVRYIKRPMPIILEDFSLDNLSINGKNGSEEFYANGKCCELPEQLHEEILQRAVELAKVAWASSLEEVASLQAIQASGVRSE